MYVIHLDETFSSNIVIINCNCSQFEERLNVKTQISDFYNSRSSHTILLLIQHSCYLLNIQFYLTSVASPSPFKSPTYLTSLPHPIRVGFDSALVTFSFSFPNIQKKLIHSYKSLVSTDSSVYFIEKTLWGQGREGLIHFLTDPYAIR